LRFEHVSSFYYLNTDTNDNHRRYLCATDDEGIYSELIAISFRDKNVDLISKIYHDKEEKPYKQLTSAGNFLLEIWSGLFIIEAQRVIIDGEVFDVRESLGIPVL